MSIEKVREFVAANDGKDVSTEDYNSFVSGLATDKAIFESIVATPTFKSHKDSIVSKALSTREAGLQVELETKLTKQYEEKYNPPKNPWEEKVAALEARAEASDRKAELLQIKSKVQGKLNTPELLNYMNLSTNEDEALGQVDAFNDLFAKSVNEGIAAAMKDATRTPGTPDKKPQVGTPSNLEELEAMPMAYHTDPKNEAVINEITARGE